MSDRRSTNQSVVRLESICPGGFQVNDLWRRHTVWSPFTYIRTVWVKLLLLQIRVENTKVRGCVGTAPSDPLPVERVTCFVGINKGVPEPRLANSPFKPQVLGEQRGSDHAHPIMHEARLPESLNTRVDDPEPRAPKLPRVESCVAFNDPRECVEAGIEVALFEGAEVKCRVLGEFTPPELREKHPDVSACRQGLVPDLAWADFPPPQVGRKLGSRLFCGKISSRVLLHSVFEELIERSMSCRLTRFPPAGDTSSPIRVGRSQQPGVQRFTLDITLHTRQLFGGRKWVCGCVPRCARPPECGVHLIGEARPGCDYPRFEQQITRVGTNYDTGLPQRGLKLCVVISRRAIPPVPQHPICAARTCYGRDDFFCRAAAQNKWNPELSKRMIQRAKRLVQPPFCGSPERSNVFRYFIEKVEHDYAVGIVCRGAERSIVAQSQIIAEPHEGCRLTVVRLALNIHLRLIGTGNNRGRTNVLYADSDRGAHGVLGEYRLARRSRSSRGNKAVLAAAPDAGQVRSSVAAGVRFRIPSRCRTVSLRKVLCRFAADNDRGSPAGQIRSRDKNDAGCRDATEWPTRAPQILESRNLHLPNKIPHRYLERRTHHRRNFRASLFRLTPTHVALARHEAQTPCTSLGRRTSSATIPVHTPAEGPVRRQIPHLHQRACSSKGPQTA